MTHLALDKHALYLLTCFNQMFESASKRGVVGLLRLKARRGTMHNASAFWKGLTRDVSPIGAPSRASTVLDARGTRDDIWDTLRAG